MVRIAAGIHYVFNELNAKVHLAAQMLRKELKGKRLLHQRLIEPDGLRGDQGIKDEQESLGCLGIDWGFGCAGRDRMRH
jgi:hypothetical protein